MRSMTKPLLIAACAWSLWACATTGARGADSKFARLSAGELLEVAALLEQSGEHMRAQQYLQQALRQGAPATQVVPRLLRLYVADAQYRLAVDQAENYLRVHPRDQDVRRFLAALYGALDCHAQAVAQYARVLAAEPKDAQAHFALASTLHDSGQEPLRADQHFRAYLTLDPGGAHAEEARSLLLTELP
jgi:tetratricopeptide (TPR) repeat protein